MVSKEVLDLLLCPVSDRLCDILCALEAAGILQHSAEYVKRRPSCQLSSLPLLAVHKYNNQWQAAHTLQHA